MEVEPVGLLVNKRAELYPKDGDLLIDAFYTPGLLELELLGLIKNLAVEAVLLGVLVAFWGASFLLQFPSPLFSVCRRL